jgi:hypothetical protein
MLVVVKLLYTALIVRDSCNKYHVMKLIIEFTLTVVIFSQYSLGYVCVCVCSCLSVCVRARVCVCFRVYMCIWECMCLFESACVWVNEYMSVSKYLWFRESVFLTVSFYMCGFKRVSVYECVCVSRTKNYCLKYTNFSYCGQHILVNWFRV